MPRAMHHLHDTKELKVAGKSGAWPLTSMLRERWEEGSGHDRASHAWVRGYTRVVYWSAMSEHQHGKFRPMMCRLVSRPLCFSCRSRHSTCRSLSQTEAIRFRWVQLPHLRSSKRHWGSLQLDWFDIPMTKEARSGALKGLCLQHRIKYCTNYRWLTCKGMSIWWFALIFHTASSTFVRSLKLRQRSHCLCWQYRSPHCPFENTVVRLQRQHHSAFTRLIVPASSLLWMFSARCCLWLFHRSRCFSNPASSDKLYL